MRSDVESAFKKLKKDIDKTFNSVILKVMIHILFLKSPEFSQPGKEGSPYFDKNLMRASQQRPKTENKKEIRNFSNRLSQMCFLIFINPVQDCGSIAFLLWNPLYISSEIEGKRCDK